jgi:aspartyl protease family protein
MREALIFAGLLIGGVAALFPTEKPALQPGIAAAAKTVRPQSASGAPDRLAGPTELMRASDGHFYAPVTVGSQPITMLVDTGATVVALTGEDARLAGIWWDPGQLKTVAQGAGGPVKGVTVTIPLMHLGNHEARNVAAVIIPEGLPVSLLGQAFLRDIEPVRIEKDRMILGG